MAINLGALNEFLRVSNAGNSNIVHVRQGGKDLGLGGVWSKAERSGRTDYDKARNNETRQAFLVSLGKALGLDQGENPIMSTNPDGTIRLNKGFLKAIERQLGSGIFKSGDYKLDKNGHVTSGRPLTERRITAVVSKMIDKAQAAGQDVGAVREKQTNVQSLVSKRFGQGTIVRFGLGEEHAQEIERDFLSDMGIREGSKAEQLFHETFSLKVSVPGQKKPVTKGVFEVLCSRDNALASVKEQALAILQDRMSAFLDKARKQNLGVGDAPELSCAALQRRIEEAVGWAGETEVPQAMTSVEYTANDATPENIFDCFRRNVERTADASNGTSASLRRDAEAHAEKRGVQNPDMFDYLAAMADYAAENMVKIVCKELKLPKVDGEAMTDLLVNKLGEAKDMDDFIAAFSKGLKEMDTSLRIYPSSLKTALAKSLYNGVEPMNKTINALGGGIGAVETFRYEHEGKAYASKTVPREHLLNIHSGTTEKRETGPLVELCTSTLTTTDDEGKEKTLTIVNRFGSRLSNSGETTIAHYKDLAIQTFLANPKLRERAERGETQIEVPIYRLDMAPENQVNAEKIGGPKLILGDGEEDKIKTTLFYKTAEGKEVAVHLKPHVRHVILPTDSIRDFGYGKYYDRSMRTFTTPDANATVLTEEQSTLACEVVEELTKEIEKSGLQGKDLEDVQALARQLKGFTQDYLGEGKRLTYQDDHKFGATMQRFGARLALLAIKLGHVPAINCNWGRDRTGAMDSEIKMLALQLEEGKELAPIVQGDDDQDPDIGLRTELLAKNGENELARQITMQSHPVNLRQGGGVTGFIGLFNTDEVR